MVQNNPQQEPSSVIPVTAMEGTVLDWHSRPLDWEDLLAALSLLSLGLTSIIVYIVVMKIMKQQDKVNFEDFE